MATILAIDDNELLVETIDLYLTELGYRVHAAKNGKEGLQLFDTHRHFDLVITDIDMPVLDGYAVARHIRSSEKAKTPIVAITGGELQAVHEEMFDVILQKPFKLAMLENIIRSYVPQFLTTKAVSALRGRNDMGHWTDR